MYKESTIDVIGEEIHRDKHGQEFGHLEGAKVQNGKDLIGFLKCFVFHYRLKLWNLNDGRPFCRPHKQLRQ